MSTKSLTLVQLNHKIKLAQKCAFDGFPSGQGQTITDFLINSKINLDNFNNLTEISEPDYLNLLDSYKNKLDPDTFLRDYPQFNKELGADILELINLGKINSVILNIDFARNSLFCEYAYLINFDNFTLEVYKGFNKIPLTESDRFFYLQDMTKKYFPIKLVKVYGFSDLEPDTMEKLENELEENEEDLNDSEIA